MATATAERLPTEEELAAATEALDEATRVAVSGTWEVRNLVESVARYSDADETVGASPVVPSLEEIGRVWAWVRQARLIVEELAHNVEHVADRLDDLDDVRIITSFHRARRGEEA